MSAFDTQVGGDHYKDMVIQPTEFCQRNRLGFCESVVVKYVCRHQKKGGKQDIDKAIHFLEMLKELEYPENNYQSKKGDTIERYANCPPVIGTAERISLNIHRADGLDKCSCALCTAIEHQRYRNI